MARGRPNPLNDPEFALSVAETMVSGATRAEICRIFSLKDKHTVSRWRRDPRVKAHTLKLIEERSIQVKRKTDSEIERRLQDPGELSVKELLDIRREFAGDALGDKRNPADATGAVAEALEAFEKNPELATQLSDLLNQAV